MDWELEYQQPHRLVQLHKHLWVSPFDVIAVHGSDSSLTGTRIFLRGGAHISVTQSVDDVIKTMRESFTK